MTTNQKRGFPTKLCPRGLVWLKDGPSTFDLIILTFSYIDEKSLLTTPPPFSPLFVHFLHLFLQPLSTTPARYVFPFPSFLTFTHTTHYYSSTRSCNLLLCFLSFRFTPPLCLQLLHSKRIPCVNHAQIQLLPINRLL